MGHMTSLARKQQVFWESGCPKFSFDQMLQNIFFNCKMANCATHTHTEWNTQKLHVTKSKQSTKHPNTLNMSLSLYQIGCNLMEVS